MAKKKVAKKVQGAQRTAAPMTWDTWGDALRDAADAWRKLAPSPSLGVNGYIVAKEYRPVDGVAWQVPRREGTPLANASNELLRVCEAYPTGSAGKRERGLVAALRRLTDALRADPDPITHTARSELLTVEELVNEADMDTSFARLAAETADKEREQRISEHREAIRRENRPRHGDKRVEWVRNNKAARAMFEQLRTAGTRGRQMSAFNGPAFCGWWDEAKPTGKQKVYNRMQTIVRKARKLGLIDGAKGYYKFTDEGWLVLTMLGEHKK